MLILKSSLYLCYVRWDLGLKARLFLCWLPGRLTWRTSLKMQVPGPCPQKVWFNFSIFSTLACAFKDLCHSPTLENSQLLSLQILPLHYSLKALFQKYLLDMSDLFILSPAFLELFHIFYFLISLCWLYTRQFALNSLTSMHLSTIYYYYWFFLGLHPQHMEVARPGVKSQL